MNIDLFEEEDIIITTERLVPRLMKEDAVAIFEIRGDWDTASDAAVPCMKSIEEARLYSDSRVV